MDSLISFVIANYNYGAFLEEAIKSIVAQPGFEECELIVIDGRSTDGSVDVIRKYTQHIAWWVSERDTGQSEAFNKGFQHASGKYLTWLNADDILVRGCLLKVISAMKKYPDTEWFTANTFRFNTDGTIYEIWWGPHCWPKMLQHKNSPIAPYGPTTFFSKKIFDCVGGMDESLRYVMDSDLWVRFMANGIVLRRINCFCWGFRMHPNSKTAEFKGHNLEAHRREQLMSEIRKAQERVGYRMSQMLRWIGIGWRLIDGSIIRKIWYRCTIRDVWDKRIGGMP